MENDSLEFANNDLFNAFSNPIDINALTLIKKQDSNYNYCIDCNVIMQISGTVYQCQSCGQTVELIADCSDTSTNNGGCIKISSGQNKGKCRNVNNNYAKTQKKNILNQLTQLQSEYKGTPFSYNTLVAVADRYNKIQTVIKDRGETEKSVRRGAMKDEIIAALIYFECIRGDNTRVHRDIIEFMKLTTNGFSRGEELLRDLEANGLIDIPVNKEAVVKDFASRYLEILDLTDPSYLEFIVDIVNQSNKSKISMNSQISSKVVGALWTLIIKLKLGISVASVEKASDNTKKNTFVKFSNAIDNNITVFAEIFRKYNIPY